MIPTIEGRNAQEGVETRIKRVIFLLNKEFKDNTFNRPQRKKISNEHPLVKNNYNFAFSL